VGSGVDEDILGLDIPMAYTFEVAVGDSFEHLIQIKLGEHGREVLALLVIRAR